MARLVCQRESEKDRFLEMKLLRRNFDEFFAELSILTSDINPKIWDEYLKDQQFYGSIVKIPRNADLQTIDYKLRTYFHDKILQKVNYNL